MKDRKIVHDSVHGSITVEGVFLDLIETAEFQRLHDIKQLGLAYLVFPGAHHTRLEHSLGTYQIATMMCKSLRVEEKEAVKIKCAALLHDVAHAPFSHTLEWLLKDMFGFTHDELAEEVITGRESMLPEAEKGELEDLSTIVEVVEKHQIEPKEIARLIKRNDQDWDSEQSRLVQPGKAHFNILKYPIQIIHGPVDCDQIDYLMRDSHHTGVAHGVIDLDRLLDTLSIHNDDLVVELSGIPAVEGMLVARALMFTTVYFHKTVRIAELMLAKAAERLEREEIDAARKQSDFGFLWILKEHDDFSKRIITSLKYRRLYKAALVWKSSDIGEQNIGVIERLQEYQEKMSIEENICRRAGVPSGSVILDVPNEEIATTEPRMSSVNIGILDGEMVKPLSRISPLANALQIRKVQDWVLMVACPSKMRIDVEKAAKRVLLA